MAQAGKNTQAPGGPEFRVVASGDLGASRRTIGGLLGQFELVELDEAQIHEVMAASGLPARAAADPTFPISLEQDLRILNQIRLYLPATRSLVVNLFDLIQYMKLHIFGLFGLALQSAPTLADALRVPLTYPQLNWGRSRMTLRSAAHADELLFELARSRVAAIDPDDLDQAHTHSMLLDLVGTIALMAQIVEDPAVMQQVSLPVPEPPDWRGFAKTLDYPVEFDAPAAVLRFAPGFFQLAPANAHDLGHRAAMKIVEREAQMLDDGKSTVDRVSRWLWAYTPPLSKPEIAKLMGVSIRSLTRALADEGSSYNALFAAVQAERAMNLLVNRRLTTAEVGYRLGYSDPAAFTRAFTAWTGQSPGRWRAKPLGPAAPAAKGPRRGQSALQSTGSLRGVDRQ